MIIIIDDSMIIFFIQIKLAHHDGSPVRDATNPVIISYGYTYNQSRYSNISRMLDDNGMVELNFYPPNHLEDDASPLNIEVIEKMNIRYFF